MDYNWLPLLDHPGYPPAERVTRPMQAFDGSPLPQATVICFMNDVLESYVSTRELAPIASHHSETKDFPLYRSASGVGLIHGPVGAPASVLLMEALIAGGVRRIVACGGCGVLESHEEGKILLATRALRDEGTSYCYLPAAPWIDLAGPALESARLAIACAGIPFAEIALWTTDGFFCETPELIARRLSQGCQAVDMECSALAAVAQVRNVEFAEILYSGDYLDAYGAHDERNWITDGEARTIALAVALAACGDETALSASAQDIRRQQ